MKKLAFLLLFCLVVPAGNLFSQSTDYFAFYGHFSKHLNEFENLNRDIDTMNSHGASYSKLTGHFTYGFGIVKKKGFLETGGNMYWGNTKEIFAGTSDSVGNTIVFTDYWVRQRLFSLNYRIGLSLGDHISLGTDLGGILSNFQHFNIDHDKTPIWFLSFAGQRSFLGSVSPYLSIHTLIGESGYINLEPYVTFTFGQTKYDQAFNKAEFYPNSTLIGQTQMRFFGLRIAGGIGSER